MSNLPKRTRVRKSNSLPLFDWAERNGSSVFNPLLITRKLSHQLKMPASTLNLLAELNGFKGREGSKHDH